VKKPAWRGYLGPRTVAAFLAVLVLGIALYAIGVATTATMLKGLGVLFGFMGLVLTVGLLLRWLIYKEVG
jgi:hypothetical protein